MAGDNFVSVGQHITCADLLLTGSLILSGSASTSLAINGTESVNSTGGGLPDAILNPFFGSTFLPFEVVTAGQRIVFTRADNSVGPVSLAFYKTRAADASQHAAVQNGDGIARFQFVGDDGTNPQESARIEVSVDGAVGAGSVPMGLFFKTGTSGGGAERLRINSNGVITASGALTSSGGITVTAGSLGVADAGEIVNLGGFARVTGADFTTASTSLVDVTGLSVALFANQTYQFTAMLSTASGDANGVGVGVQFSAAGASVEAQAQGSTTGGANAQAVRISALNTSTAAFNTVAADGVIEINGIFITGANAGNLTIQERKVTSGTATCRKQSYLSVMRIA